MMTVGPACRRLLASIVARARRVVHARLWARPAVGTHVAGTRGDLPRGRAQLLAGNALLRHRVIVLRRRVKRPPLTSADRALLVLFAGQIRAWRRALLLVRPETLLRRHRAGFRAHRRRQSRPGPGRPPLPDETVALVRRLAAENRLWGAGRIRGERGKLGIRVAKRAIQTYSRGAAAPHPRGQARVTFPRNHAADVWACDFLPVTDLLRPLFASFTIALATRRVVHVAATRHPTDARAARQLREATPFGHQPKYRIRDNDGKYGAASASVAAASGIAALCTPVRAPRANAVCERCPGGVRRECPDHLLVLGARHLARVLHRYVAYSDSTICGTRRRACWSRRASTRAW